MHLDRLKGPHAYGGRALSSLVDESVRAALFLAALIRVLRIYVLAAGESESSRTRSRKVTMSRTKPSRRRICSPKAMSDTSRNEQWLIQKRARNA